MSVDLLDYYQLENGTVIRVVGESRDTLTVEQVEDGHRFPVRRDPFTVDVKQGYVQRVEPEFRPADETAEPAG